ncbi:MAG: IS3 family transposase [Lentisphaerota bacterium]
MIERESEIKINRQCEILGLPRSRQYSSSMDITKTDIGDEDLMKKIDKIYTECPFYGSRRIKVALLRNHSLIVNRKKIQRLMRIMGIYGQSPGIMTSRRCQKHKKYPYLLRDIDINRPCMAWCSDITYLPIAQGHVYLVAIMDWHSRYIIAWELSNTLDSEFCLQALRKSFAVGKPDIFNTDQGCQFTSEAFIGELEKANVRISMDGKGRCLDNIFIERFWRSLKYEDIYMKDYSNVKSLREGVESYIKFYNNVRPHQSLGYRTPSEIHYKREAA